MRKPFSWTKGMLLIVTFVLTAMLSGCAGQMAFQDAKQLASEHRDEESLNKFQDAIRKDPQNAEYRMAYLQNRDRFIAKLIEEAESQVKAKSYDEASKTYQRILRLDDKNDRARLGLRDLEWARKHEKLIQQAESALKKEDYETCKKAVEAILADNPHHESALAIRRTLEEMYTKNSVAHISNEAYQKTITLEFRNASLRQIFEVISRTSNLNFIFDKDVKLDQKNSIFLKQSTVEAAIDFLLLTNQLEQRVLDGNTVIIFPNSPLKQKEYQEMVIKTFFLTNADAKTVASSLKSILQAKNIVIDEKLNMLIVRDTKDTIALAEKMVALQDMPEPEVMLEVEILEVKRTRLMELGIQAPNSLTLTPLATDSSSSLTLHDLDHISTRTTGATISSANIKANLEDSDVNLLANPRIRARNHEKAKILIGDRVPNITTTATSTGFVSESINYIDVGLKLEVEPSVHLNNDVAIKVALEVSSIVDTVTTSSGTKAYQLGTRTASTVLRLKDGETQVLAGLINDEDRQSGNKIPGLGDLPLLGRLFGVTSDDTQKTEIVLSITPHLIRNIQRPDAFESQFFSGTESTLRHRQPKFKSKAEPQKTATLVKAAPVKTLDANKATNADTVQASPVTKTELRWQGPTDVKVGGTFSLQLSMQSIEPVTGLPIALHYDNTALQLLNVTEGSFLKAGGKKTNFTSKPDSAGNILIASTRLSKPGATTEGEVFTLKFKALKKTDSGKVSIAKLLAVGESGTNITLPLPSDYQVRITP